MPLFKNFIDKSQADQVVASYDPPSIEATLDKRVVSFVESKSKSKNSDFKVDAVLANYIGLDQFEKESQDREIAEKALALSKEIQEEAYAEAYKIGLEEGTKKAFAEEKERLESQINRMRAVVQSIKDMKMRAMKKNEKQIVGLCFHIAQKIAMRNITEDVGYVKELIAKVLDSLQSEEKMTVKMSEEDFTWFQSNRENFFKDLEIPETTKVEADPAIEHGGVIIETDIGIIDATIENRINKMEQILKGHS